MFFVLVEVTSIAIFLIFFDGSIISVLRSRISQPFSVSYNGLSTPPVKLNLMLLRALPYLKLMDSSLTVDCLGNYSSSASVGHSKFVDDLFAPTKRILVSGPLSSSSDFISYVSSY